MDGPTAAFRDVMRSFPTGVTIVGSAHDGQKRGMTVNSFTSVSLNPPTVLICIMKDSRCHPVIERSGVFSVSVLAENQSELSRKFADHDEVDVHRFVGVDHHVGDTGAPLVDGALAELECAVEDQLGTGDHTVFVGKVVSAKVTSDESPLVFHRSRYAKVGGAAAGS